jgi:hypothetical protein
VQPEAPALPQPHPERQPEQGVLRSEAECADGAKRADGGCGDSDDSYCGGDYSGRAAAGGTAGALEYDPEMPCLIRKEPVVRVRAVGSGSQT